MQQHLQMPKSFEQVVQYIHSFMSLSPGRFKVEAHLQQVGGFCILSNPKVHILEVALLNRIHHTCTGLMCRMQSKAAARAVSSILTVCWSDGRVVYLGCVALSCREACARHLISICCWQLQTASAPDRSAKPYTASCSNRNQ